MSVPAVTDSFEQERTELKNRHEIARDILINLIFSFRDTRIALRQEHLQYLPVRFESADMPDKQTLARWGTNRPVFSIRYKHDKHNRRQERIIETYKHFEELEKEEQEHAVVHELAEALLDVKILRSNDWRHIAKTLDASSLEDTRYTRHLQEELARLDDAAYLSAKAKEANLELNEYRELMQRRVRHERLAEAFAFYLQSGGDEEKMLSLRLEHTSTQGLPEKWRSAYDANDLEGSQDRLRMLYEKSSPEDRHQYFGEVYKRNSELFRLFDGVMGNPQKLDQHLDEADSETQLDEEYEELLDLDFIEESYPQQWEAAGPLNMPKIKKGSSLWDLFKAIFSGASQAR